MSNYLEIPQTPRAKSPLGEAQAFPNGSRKMGRDGHQLGDQRLSGDPASDIGTASAAGFRMGEVAMSAAASPPGRVSKVLRSFWARNRPALLVAAAQVFGAMMNLCARLLELDPSHKMHPFQILFIRMTVTSAGSLVYMCWNKVPYAPLGRKEVRWLLVLRGCTGFFGLYGMWYSMMYIPLAEATVITFLVPSVAGYMCHVLLHDPFTRKEQLASFIALAGVVLIAKPTSFFSLGTGSAHTVPSTAIDAPTNSTSMSQSSIGNTNDVSPTERLIAIGVALLGVLGGSGAFTSIRWIGTRAHPLISVTYFSATVMLVAMAVLSLAPLLDIAQPALRFGLPHRPLQWLYVLLICVCGFATQFLLTAGLGAEKSNRATAMVYTHMLFAAGFDKWVFGHEMGLVSLGGCGLIVGSALWVVLTKKSSAHTVGADDVELAGVTELGASPMLRHGMGLENEDTDDEQEAQALIDLDRDAQARVP